MYDGNVFSSKETRKNSTESSLQTQLNKETHKKLKKTVFFFNVDGSFNSHKYCLSNIPFDFVYII